MKYSPKKITKILLIKIKKRLKSLKKSVRQDRRLDVAEKNLLRLLQQKYSSLVKNTNPKTTFRNQEFNIYSQSGEDGLLLYIFSKIGTTNCYFIEIGCGDGRTCNTANLSLNFGWSGILIDYLEKSINTAKEYYQSRPDIKIIKSFVTAENINEVLLEHCPEREIDLLSIDIDGNDYWILKAIKAVKPRVIIIEYNASFGSDKSITVKYDPGFLRYRKHESGWYHGASLTALTKLANSLGYILVGCESGGVNVLFVRRDLAKEMLPEVAVAEAYYPHSSRIRVATTAEQFERIKHLDFTYV